MNRKIIYKYTLNHSGATELMLPYGAEVLAVLVQDHELRLWALVTPENDPVKVRFKVFGTGWEIPPEPMVHVGTAQTGPFVWHVFRLLDYVIG